jgi:endonuclease/exonuclease/phosphatase family metal-dependent hydrolase
VTEGTRTPGLRDHNPTLSPPELQSPRSAAAHLACSVPLPRSLLLAFGLRGRTSLEGGPIVTPSDLYSLEGESVDPSTRPDGMVVRVATYNARHGVGRFGIVSRRGLVGTCRSLDADILALQEVDRFVARSWFRDQPAMIARALAMRHVTAPAKRAPGGGSQCNALCARGRLADVEILELPRPPGIERRVAILSRVTLSATAISVACTHLQHRGGVAREQLVAVLDRLLQRPAPRLLAGDLNIGPEQVEPILAARGFRAAPSGPTFPAHAPRTRIDWIAVDAGLEVVAARLHRALVGDHTPLVADLAVTARGVR